MKPSLLILCFSELATDARVLKQIRALTNDYRVTTCGFGPAPVAGVEHLEVHRDGSARHRTLATMALGFADVLFVRMHVYEWTYRRIPFVREATRLLKGRRFDVALANDVDTVPLAIDVVGASRVHADLHEYFPGIHETSTVLGRRQASYLTWLVRRYASRARSSTTVGDGIAIAYRQFGLDPGVVTNATPKADLVPTPVSQPIRLVHSGNAQPSRQLELVMDAVAQTTANVTLDLYLMPNDVVYLEQLTALAKALGPRVQLREPVPQVELVDRLNAYDVGLHVLPPSSFNNANALPNKFFDYVQARLGLIIGPSPEMSRRLEEYGFGAVASDFTVQAVREVLDGLTITTVTEWKARSDTAAESLSATSQIEIWRAAISRIASETTPGH